MSEDNPFFTTAIQLPSNSPVAMAAQAAQFPDLHSAGRHLARSLEEFNARKEFIVLGLALGGVPVAFEVASHLGLPMDFVLLRRLLAPQGPGSQVCAASVAGSLVIDEELMPRPVAPESAFDHFVSTALDDLAKRERVCRGARPAVELGEKNILLVDCGIRTGLTMKAAISALRRKAPAQIIAAVPAASAEGRSATAAIADKVICLASPEPFGHVGLWYKDFRRPGDDQISELLGLASTPDW